MRCAIASCLGMLSFAVIGCGSAWADAGEGRQLAQRWCSSCHLVGDRQQGSVPQGPPSFRTVAKGGMTDVALRAFLSHPHGAMPDFH
jgi:mono/diheme cytochrome c family protein